MKCRQWLPHETDADLAWIPLANDKGKALVDKVYAEHLCQRNWSLKVNHVGQRYARASYKGKTVYLHQIVYGKAPNGMEVDHINGDGLDCRRSNLRWVTKSENQGNSKHNRAAREAAERAHNEYCIVRSE